MWLLSGAGQKEQATIHTPSPQEAWGALGMLLSWCLKTPCLSSHHSYYLGWHRFRWLCHRHFSPPTNSSYCLSSVSPWGVSVNSQSWSEESKRKIPEMHGLWVLRLTLFCITWWCVRLGCESSLRPVFPLCIYYLPVKHLAGVSVTKVILDYGLVFEPCLLNKNPKEQEQ